MKTEFVSTVSHELRTPLTSIKGSLHLLMSDEQLVLDETQRQLVDISLKNTDRLIRLINNILDISKMEAGHIQLDLEHAPARRTSSSWRWTASVAFAESRRISIETQLRGGAAVGARRRRPHGAGGDQPALERDQVLAAEQERSRWGPAGRARTWRSG